jgi:hypothetical protein
MDSFPVVFIIFKRIETTAKVFSEIAKAKPKKLFVIADGPRPDKTDEAELCAQTRAIINNVDWDCDVETNFSEINMGCALRISSGLHWVFERAEAAIILEDDCLPQQTFFPYCEELLQRYWNDTRIFNISGSHLPWYKKRVNTSYFFSANPHIWGWATWKRAWKYYDIKLSFWPELKNGDWLVDCLDYPKKELKYFLKMYQHLYDTREKPFTWDYQWGLCCNVQSASSIVPTANMVSNIGFGIGESHSNAGKNICSDNPTEPINFPLVHPSYMINDALYDKESFKFLFDASLRRKIARFLDNPGEFIRNKATRLRKGMSH